MKHINDDRKKFDLDFYPINVKIYAPIKEFAKQAKFILDFLNIEYVADFEPIKHKSRVSIRFIKI